MAEDTEVKEVKEVKKRRRRRPLGKHKLIRLICAAAVLLMAVFTLTVVTAMDHYRTYPGKVEGDSVCSPGRGSDYIVVGWSEARNTDVYKVWWKEVEPEPEQTADAEGAGEAEDKGAEQAGTAESEGNGTAAEGEAKEGVESDAAENKGAAQTDSETDEAAEAESEEPEEVVIDDSWTEAETDVPEITINDLKEDTRYSFIIRADSKEKEGTPTPPKTFTTKRPQKLKVSKKITKFTFSEPFKLKVSAETDVIYESSDPKVAEVDPETQKIKITGAGDAEITVTARSSSEFESASKVVQLKVIDSTAVSAGGASAHIIYHLSPDNCEVVKSITGAGGAVIPQGLAYTGDKYIVAYGMGSPNRVISFDVDGDGKSVSVPSVSMGHPNGFTYANENGLCYCAKGWTSKVYTYEPTSDSYGSVNLSYGCSGIGYDRKEKLLYTCSRTAMVAYDISDGYSVKYRCGVVKHGGTTYTQDCGGHAGIMFRCLSGSSKHGTNYIDLYDMKNGRYLGTLSCDLSEVESCIVDKDGFLEILANNSGSVDYIWKTDLNIDTLGEGL